ncbi:MAG: COG1361 S-layer family protein [archaeon]|jgi:hypothetical protein
MISMKKIIFLTILSLMILPNLFAVTYNEGLNLNATLINQSPDPVRSGDLVEFKFSIQNSGNIGINNAIVTLDYSYPFEEVPSEDYNLILNRISPFQKEDNAQIVTYKLLVNKDAPNGDYEINLKVINPENEIGNVYKFNISVAAKDYAQIITINKSNISFGKVEDLKFLITNTGNSPLKNIVFSWSDPTETLLPVNSDNTKYIKFLDVGSSVVVDYNVMANSNSTPGLYKLNLSLKFENEDYNSSEINTIAGIFVGGLTDFDITFAESSSGSISLSIANIGNDPAYSVNVIIPEQTDYKVGGTNSSILGNLDKGDYTIASFNISSKRTTDFNSISSGSRTTRSSTTTTQPMSNTQKTGPLKVIIQYTDSLGTRNSLTKEVNIQTSGSIVSTTASTGQFTRKSTGPNWYIYIIIGLVVLVAGFYAYKFYSKNKIKKK